MNYCAVLVLTLAVLVGCTNESVLQGVPSGTAKTGVILLRYSPGSESTEQRERGFLDTMKKEFPEIAILSDNQYAGTTHEAARDKSEQLLLKYRDAVTGVFAVNESSAAGMFGALEENGLLGKVALVGFDPNERMVQALAEGKNQGIILQDPVKMGFLAVKTMRSHLEGEAVERWVSTGESVATPENQVDEEMQRLLKPEHFSGEDFVPTEVKYHIAVIPKGTSQEFWQSVHAGAHNAAKELGDVQIHWKGPIREDDADGQIDVVRDFITKKVDGICLAPLDSQALLEVVKEAKAAKIPCVIFDSNLIDNDVQISYVATDNYAGGAKAARRLAEVLQMNE